MTTPLDSAPQTDADARWQARFRAIRISLPDWAIDRPSRCLYVSNASGVFELYTWDRDTGPTSTCTGNCAATWPPLVLASGTTTPVPGTGVSELTTSPRPDDATKMQVVWKGKPLYYYAADTAPGDTKGDGVGGTWHVAKPS